MRQTCQNLNIFCFQSNFFCPKINLIFLKTNFILEYWIRRTFFIKIIFNFVHIQTNLFCKIVPNIWWLCLKLSFKVSKNPSKGLIRMQKTIEIHLPHYKIPQQSPHYFILAFDLIFEIMYFSFAQKIRMNLELPVFSNPFVLDAGTKPFVIHFDIGLQPGNISSLYLLCLSFKIFQNSSSFRYSLLSLLIGC